MSKVSPCLHWKFSPSVIDGGGETTIIKPVLQRPCGKVSLNFCQEKEYLMLGITVYKVASQL